jgi:protein-disulfide isomerase
MNKGTVLALLVVVLGGGYGLGKLVIKDKGNTATASAKIAMPGANEKAPSDGVDRVRVPPEGATKGGANAKVTIVEFSDFQCPFCSRVVPTLHQIEKEYGDKVTRRLPAQPAAVPRGCAAGRRGRRRGPGAGQVLGDARQAVRQPADHQAPRPREVRAGDRARRRQVQGRARQRRRQGADREPTRTVAAQVGANGTPNFYIDGRNVVGAQPFEEFKKVID